MIAWFAEVKNLVVCGRETNVIVEIRSQPHEETTQSQMFVVFP